MAAPQFDNRKITIIYPDGIKRVLHGDFKLVETHFVANPLTEYRVKLDAMTAEHVCPILEKDDDIESRFDILDL